MPVTAMRVVLIDDHPLFSQGLRLLLKAVTDGRVAVEGHTSDAARAVDLVRRWQPDVALIDLAMPPPGGLAAIRAVKRAHPGVRLLALSGVTEDGAAVDALRAGADGFLRKTAEPQELLHPLLALVEGHSVLPREVLQVLVDGAVRPGAEVLTRLDSEDRALLRRIAEGESTDDIARALIVSERTAKRMVASILRKVDAANRIQAAAIAGRSGLLEHEQR